ncbi:MAG TPA: hypothetical protein VGA80_11845 [Flavobacteriaceae bacterium]
MIKNIDKKSILSELDRTKLPTYWSVYLQYEKDDELSSLTKDALIEEIEKERVKEKPFIDSQIVISKLLTKFSENHSFHRQFREKHPNLDNGQTLGMQLYHLMIQDKDIWTYIDTKKRGHLFSHATYFK